MLPRNKANVKEYYGQKKGLTFKNMHLRLPKLTKEDKGVYKAFLFANLWIEYDDVRLLSSHWR